MGPGRGLDNALIDPGATPSAQIIEEATAAINRGDPDAFLRPMSADFELDLSRAIGPFKGCYGRERVAEFLAEFTGSWESLQIEVNELIEADGLVVAPATLHGKGRAGIEVTARPTFVWAIKDGLVERLTMYQEREDALADLGLAG
ncbi:MAG: nuclear transport factor 2 family protein [Solirubrobacterales bacterium]